MAVADWFLTGDERGNPSTSLHPWTEGNLVTPLVHGATYYGRLLDELRRLGPDAWVHILDWRGDGDERLDGEGTEVGHVLAGLARRGVSVRGLLWRSHPDEARLSEQEAVHLAETVNEAGGELLLDERVRRAGSHHQKLVLIRHPATEDDDIAFMGGIDLCHGRRDDERHRGDPQAADLDPRYGPTPPWHDVQLEVRGPAVRDLALTFRERWEDDTPLDHRNPLRFVQHRRSRQVRHPDPLPPMPDAPGPVGHHTVQVLRTYPWKRPAYPFAPAGERSVARAYRKAFTRARRLIYLEDQYLWSQHVAAELADALRRAPELRVIAVVPRFPERDGRISGPPLRIGHQQALDTVREAGGDRVGVYDLQNDEGVPVYVHAKVCVVDDTWCSVGSDNLNLRSWSHDSELSCAVLDTELDGREPRDPGGRGDGARRLARDLRLRLWSEHLGRPPDDPELIDPVAGFEAWRTAARSGRGRVGEHQPRRLGRLASLWAAPVYRFFVDPDGRPRNMRHSRDF